MDNKSMKYLRYINQSFLLFHIIFTWYQSVYYPHSSVPISEGHHDQLYQLRAIHMLTSWRWNVIRTPLSSSP